MRKPFAVLVGTLALSMLACATGPKYRDVESDFPDLTAESGRIFFYRSSSPVGGAVQPKIYLNDEVVGKSQPGGFFFVDRPPGDYRVRCTTEVKRELTFSLTPGEQKYVKTVVQMGAFVGHVLPQLESREQAMKTLEGSSYIGTQLAAD